VGVAVGQAIQSASAQEANQTGHSFQRSVDVWRSQAWVGGDEASTIQVGGCSLLGRLRVLQMHNVGDKQFVIIIIATSSLVETQEGQLCQI